MATLPLMIGLLGSAGLLLWFMYSLDEEIHMPLRLLIVFFLFATLLMVPKVMVDSRTVCEVVNTNSTVNGATTNHEYGSFCYNRPETTSITFWQNSTLLYWLFVGYAIVGIFLWGLNKVMESIKTRPKR